MPKRLTKATKRIVEEKLNDLWAARGEDRGAGCICPKNLFFSVGGHYAPLINPYCPACPAAEDLRAKVMAMKVRVLD